MPDTFTAEDFSALQADTSSQPAPAFSPDDFGGPASQPIFSAEDFNPAAPSRQPNTREARRIELKLEKARLQAEPEPKVFGATVRGGLSSIVEGVNKGAGAVVRGLGHLSEVLPPGGPDVVQGMPGVSRDKSDILGQQYQEKVSDPLKLKEAIETNPLTRAGKHMQETGEAFAPEDFERGSVVNQALSGAAELAPIMNPAAPVVIGLQGLGRDLQSDFDELKAKGASDQDAAAGAISRAEKAGFSQFAVWSVLPAPLRKFAEKYLIERVGSDGAKRFLAGRAATAGEGAVLGATSKAAENVATGQPIGQDVARSGLSMATLNLGLPRLNRAGQEIPGSERPSVAPQRPTPAPTVGTRVPVTKDLAAELQAAMKGNQVAPAHGTEVTAAAEKSAEAVKDNLVGEAVRQITGQIPGAKVTIEAPKPAESTAQTEGEPNVKPPERSASTENIAPSVEKFQPEDFAAKPPTLELGKEIPLGGMSAEQLAELQKQLDEEMGQTPETEEAPQSKVVDAKQSGVSEPGRPETTVEQPTPESKAEPKQSDDPKLIQARNRLDELVQEGKGKSDFAYKLRARIAKLEKAASSPPRVGRGLAARKIFDRETEMGNADVLDWIVDNGKLLSRTTAQKTWPKEKFYENKSDWDDAPRLSRPHHHVIYSEGGSPPNQVAQRAYDAGKIDSPNVNDLWEAIDKASKARSHAYEQERRHEKILQEEIEQNKRWQQVKATGHIRVDAEELQPGDTMELAGEHFEVTHKDPETGDVTLEDGSKFGTQRLPGGDSVYVEKLGDDLTDRLAEEPPPYRLDAAESVEEQKARQQKEQATAKEKAQREELHRRAARRLEGSRGDIGQGDMLGGGDLFSEEAGDPGLWHLSNDDLLGRIDDYHAAGDESPAARQQLDNLEREARERGLIDKTTTEEEAESRAEREAHGKLEAENEREDQRAEHDREIQRREQRGDDTGRDEGNPGEPERERPVAERAGRTLRQAASPADKARLEWLRGELARQEKILAHSAVWRDQVGSFPSTPQGISAFCSIQYLEGQIEIIITPADARSTLKGIEHERMMEQRQLPMRTRDSTTKLPASRSGVQQLGRIRFMEGQIDELLRIHDEEALRNAPGQMDLFEQWLDRAIEKTDPLSGGKMLEGVTGVPWWLTKSLANGALRILRAAYRASRDLKTSIEEAILWLHDQKPKGFDHNEARDWLNEVTEKGGWSAEDFTAGEPPKPGERPVETIKAERDQADGELRQAIHERATRPNGERHGAHTEKITAATAKLHSLQDELLEHPDYVKELLERQHAGETLLSQELDQVPEAFKERMRKELQEEGRLPKPEGLPANTGRSIDDLTDWLKQNDINSPKRSLRERLDLAGKLAQRWQGIKDTWEAARTKVAAAWRTGLEAIKHPPIDTDFRNAFKEWIFYDTWTGAQTKHWIDELKRKVDSPLRRMGISVWLDAKGDEGLLKYQRDAVPERWRPVWQKTLELTHDEQRLARRIKADFEQKLADAKSAGLMEKGREDYGVPQIWTKAPEPPLSMSDQGFATKDGPHGSPGNWAAKLDPRDPFFSFQRSHPTYFDGIMAGGIPKSLDVADLVGVYNEAFHKALGSRAAIWAMKNLKAKDGLPLVKISGSARLSTEQEPGTYFIDSHSRRESDVSVDGRPYRPIDHFALRDWKVAHKTTDGKLVFVRGDMLVHPDHYDFLKNELLKSPLREGAAGRILNPLFKSSTFLKASKLALGTFHLATVAEHAVSHSRPWMLDFISPSVRGFNIDLRDRSQALLVKHGLELGLSGPQAAFEEGLASHGGLLEKVPGLGDASRKFSDWLFKSYIPRLSMKTALRVLDRNMERYGGKLSEGQIAELTAHQMNAAFGLQNYRLLGRNKILMDLNRLALLAPQFLFSRAKVVGQALKPYGAEQRQMLIFQAGALYVGCRLMNAWLDDDAHWEPKLAFNVVYHGRAYGLRTIVGDAWHMLTDFKSFWSGRLAAGPRIAIETLTQRDLRTGARKEPPFQTEWIPSRIAQNLVVDLAKWLVPVGTEGLMPGAAGREQGPVDTLLSSAGIGSHKYTAQTEVSEWARSFNRKGDAHARTYQRQRDAEPHGESTYRKLDALLDAGKFDQAVTEYKALVADGHSDKSIESRYEKNQPFTGARVREDAFLQSLDEKQKKMYQRALAERKQRELAFRAMMEKAKAARN